MRKMLARVVLVLCAALSVKLLLQACCRRKRSSEKSALAEACCDGGGHGKDVFSPVGIAKACMLKRLMNKGD